MVSVRALFFRFGIVVRCAVGAALAFAMTANVATTAFADSTTGVLSGFVRSASANLPIAGASVTIASPSASRTTKTDAHGFFSLTGLSPDTYTVSVGASGYSEVVTPGVTVNAQQTTTFSPALFAVRTIGRALSRSQTSAFQPGQTQDTYTINETQINTILGNRFNASETRLIAALPGAALDVNGYPVLRGGRVNEEGFQFDGIDYTDAFTSQFVNSLTVTGQSSFQLTPGAGDASTGNAGTGAINIIVKRGTYPAFGTLDLEAGSPAFNHQLSVEYGIASPNGRFSDFLSVVDIRYAKLFGYRRADLVGIGLPVGGSTYNVSNNIINNFSYKFGRDNNQQIQLLYHNQDEEFFEQAAPGTRFQFRSNDPVALDYYGSSSGLSRDSLNAIYPLTSQQTKPNEFLATSNRNPEAFYQPNETFKLQYSNNLNDSTFLTAKFYRVQAVTTSDAPYNYDQSGGAFFGDYISIEGGQRTGFTLDITKQLGPKNLLTVGSRYDFLHPVYSVGSASAGTGAAVFSGLVYDFLPAANADCVGLALSLGGTNPCGYLSSYFPKGIPRIPQFNETTTTNRQDAAYYINDSFTASSRLKIEAGLRLDTTNVQLPTVSSGAYLPASGGGYSSGYYLPVATGLDANGNPDPSKDVYATGGNATRHPQVLEPRFAAAYTFRPTDSVRASYGRSTELVPLADMDYVIARSNFDAFAGIPANPTLGPNANGMICGPTGDRACRNYADQLFWANQNNVSGVPIQPAKPATFNNYDFSYSHDFGHGVALKINPFYRRGYDGVALVQTPLILNGQPALNPDGSTVLNPPVTTNNGITRTAGVEFYLTKEAEYGLSGSLSATYINEFSNVIPGSGSEDYFPSIPTPSLQLGNLYRVGFVSPFNVTLAATYRTRSGFKISSNILINAGYPYGSGNITAIDVNGKPVNVAQTNLTFGTTVGSQQATNYVDPQNPGSVFNPNVAASRGTPEGASPGAHLSRPRARVIIDFEYSAPHSRGTLGLQIFNLFNNVYAQPVLNRYYQPVATGISGPATGTYALVQEYGPNLGFANYGTDRFGSSAYTIAPTDQPLSYQFYYQLKL